MINEEEKELWEEDLEIIFGNDFDEIQRNIKELDLSNKTIEWLNNLVDKDISISLEHITKRIEAELNRKDKIIDLMAKYINEIDVSETVCEYCGYEDCHEEIEPECIIKYFENKVKED